MNPDFNSQEVLNRVRILERATGDIATRLNETTASVQQVVENQPKKQTITHQSLLENGELDISRNDYGYLVDVTGTNGVDADVSEEAQAWFIAEADPTELIEDATDDDVDNDPATNTTLKGPAHTLYDVAVTPNWSKSDGWAILQSDGWLCQPFRQNLMRPSLQYICSFVYRVEGADELPVNFFAGIWDNTVGKQDFLAGTAIDITAEVQGSPSATTSRTYFLVFYTNWGLTIGSQEVVVAGAPTTFSDTEYVSLSWSQPAGIIRTEIYRKTGLVVDQLNPPYPQTSYKDKGTTRGEALADFPTADTDKPIAYMETTEFNIPAAESTWQSVQINIPVPSSYDASQTTDRQWFVMGLTEAISDPDVFIFVDRISLDDKPGIFSRSPLDFDAKRNISSAPTSGDLGPVFGPGDGIDPGGTGYCPVFEMPVTVEQDGKRFEVSAIELVDNEHIYKIVNGDDVAVEYTAKVSPRPQPCYEMQTDSRKLVASHNEPVFTSERATKSLCDLQPFSDKVLTKEGVVPVASNLRLMHMRHTVRISLKGTTKSFWCSGFKVHNEKGFDNPELP